MKPSRIFEHMIGTFYKEVLHQPEEDAHGCIVNFLKKEHLDYIVLLMEEAQQKDLRCVV